MAADTWRASGRHGFGILVAGQGNAGAPETQITRRLSRGGGHGRRARTSDWRNGAMRGRPPDVAVRATVGLVVWLLILFLVVSLGRAIPNPPRWLLMLGVGLAVGFAALCVADIARAAQVRYLPKWAWALICVIQIPLGGIIYLSVGRVGRARPVPPGSVPPGSAQQP
jgi:Phospholipase_D-nuclease N-terminal